MVTVAADGEALAYERWVQVVEALGIQPRGIEQAYTRCPVHDGRTKSFSIGVGREDSRWYPRFNCWADCADEIEEDRGAWYVDVRAELIALGAPAECLAPAKGTGPRSPTPTPKVARATRHPRGTGTPPTERQVQAWQDALSGERREKLAELRCLDVETLELAEIGWHDYRYTLPVRDVRTGELVACRRYSPSSEAKMIHSPGDSAHLYAPAGFDPDRRIALCEGEFDTLVAIDAGYNAVGTTGGAGAALPVEELAAFAGCNVIIVFDADGPGEDGARKRAAELSAARAKVRIAELPLAGTKQEKDVTDLFRLGRGDELRDALDDAEPYVPAEGEAEGEDKLFRRYSAFELSVPPPPLKWTARGLLIDPTYGVIAGPDKSMKTWVALIIGVSRAAGLDILDKFQVTEPGHVHFYVGEGGRAPWQRRLHRVSEKLGVKVSELPITASFDTAALTGDKFQETLARDIEDYGPALYLLDPLYAFHPSEVQSSDLYQRGSMLTSVSAPIVAADGTLLINDHFNKTGSGTGLDRISQSGMKEGADTWLLLSHRVDPDVEKGDFRLRMDVGSRQWGGGSWALDLSVGGFDEENGEHFGELGWSLSRADAVGVVGSGGKITKAAEKTRQANFATLRDAVTDEPWQHTKTRLLDKLGGKTEAKREALMYAVREHQIKAAKVLREENGRLVPREVYGPYGDPLPEGSEAVEAEEGA